MTLSRGMGETFTVFLLPISNTFGWDRAQTVSVYSIGALCVGLARRSSGGCSITPGRAPFTRSAVLIGTGFSAAAFAQQLWQFQLCVGLAVALAARASAR